MKTINDILKNTILLLCGTVNTENDFEKINYIIKQNLDLLKNISKKISVFNTTISFEELNFVSSYLNKTYNFTSLTDHINRRYQFGFIDADLIGFNYIQHNNLKYDYILKINIDILLSSSFLNLEFNDNTDLIYFPQITSLEKSLNNEDQYKIFKENIMSFDITSLEKIGTYHQPWLYLISKNVKQIYHNTDIDRLNNLFYKWIVYVNGDYNKSHEQNIILCSESMLVNALINSNYKKYCLLRDNQFNNYCNFIKLYGIGDATIKNVYIKNYGVCHWHNKNENILEIEV